MLRAIAFCIKMILFSVFILVLGNWLRWDGKTISDQVKFRMAHTEPTRLVNTVRGWAEQLTQDARKGVQRKLDQSQADEDEEIPSSEKQKLKALIQELNGPRKKN
jgi:hypothetical protein